MKVAIVPNLQKENAVKYSKLIFEKLHSLGIDTALEDCYKDTFGDVKTEFISSKDELVIMSDIIITVGGDGTILHEAKYAIQYDKPLLGVNCGRLGFMAGMELDEIDELGRLLTGEYTVGQRMMLKVTVEKKDKIQTYYALNDVVISRGKETRMCELTVCCDGAPMTTFRADGLIFATPTGSTAYSLSAGGPVVDPLSKSIILTPLNPQALFSRPVLFGANKTLSVYAEERQQVPAQIVIDGEVPSEFLLGDKLTIQESEKCLSLIELKPRMFYEVLMRKFAERN